MHDDLAIHEELTAYLDGELNASDAQQVEQRLGTDPEYRAEMQALQKTWDLLEGLPENEANASFTQTTMEMIVGDAIKQVKAKNRTWWVWPLRLSIFLAIPLLLFGLGYGVTRYVQLEPERQLVGNLSLIENIDVYNKVGRDIDFLMKLNEEGLFAKNDEPILKIGEVLPAKMFKLPEPIEFPTLDTVQDREQKIESLGIDQKNILRRQAEAFLKLPDAEKDELNTFHNRLANHPQRAELTRSMNEYCSWLRTLGLNEQMSVRDLAAGERIKRISELQLDKAQKAFGRSGATKLPSLKDAKLVFSWYLLVINKGDREIRRSFPKIMSQHRPEVPYAQLQRYAASRRTSVRSLVGSLMRIDRDSVKQLLLDDADPLTDALRLGLSPEAREIIDDQSTQEQNELILNWIEAANESLTRVKQDELIGFYDQLSGEERDEMDKMSSSNWYQTLEDKYKAANGIRSVRKSTPSESDLQALLEELGIQEF
jgi:hypothetical protein